jgi:hypothetical protein
MLHETEEDLQRELEIARRVARLWGMHAIRKQPMDMHDFAVYRSVEPCAESDSNLTFWDGKQYRLMCGFEIRSRTKRFGSLLIDLSKVSKLRSQEIAQGIPFFLIIEWDGLTQWCRPAAWQWHGGLPSNLRVERFTRNQPRDEYDTDTVVYIPNHLIYNASINPLLSSRYA